MKIDYVYPYSRSYMLILLLYGHVAIVMHMRFGFIVNKPE